MRGIGQFADIKYNIGPGTVRNVAQLSQYPLLISRSWERACRRTMDHGTLFPLRAALFSIGVGHAHFREGLLDVARLAESGGAAIGLFYLPILILGWSPKSFDVICLL